MGVWVSSISFTGQGTCKRCPRLVEWILAAAVFAVLVFRLQLDHAAFAYIEPARALRSASGNDHPGSYGVATSLDFQQALNAARPGDVITLQAGVVLQGNFFLPERTSGADERWITIRSGSTDEALPEGIRVMPAQAAAMARLESSNSQPVLLTRSGAHHYRFEGIEFTIAPTVMLNYGIVRLGEGNEADAALLPHHLVFDRCYIHGHATADVSRGIALNSATTEIVNSYISDCHGLGFDTQAIAGWNGPGPFRIVNNYLEGAGENVMFGGADPKISGLVPSDIEFINNHCAKPLSWMEGILAKPRGVIAQGGPTPGGLASGATYYYRVAVRGRAGYSTVASSSASDEISVTLTGDQTSANISWSSVDHATETRIYRTSDAPTTATRKWVFYHSTGTSFQDLGDQNSAQPIEAPPMTATRWSVKNLLELKNARRVLVDGNVFENNWVDAQSGFSIQFTVRNQDGSARWSVVEDVSFTNNLVRHTAGGINLLGRDNLHPSEQLKRVDISGNIFDDIGGSKWGGNGRFLQITETVNVKVDHNTIFQTGNTITAYGAPNQGFVFTNNIALHNQYGIIGDGSSPGFLTLETYFPAYVLKKNVLVGAQSSKYPKKNYYPATLDDVGFVDKANGNYQLSDNSPYKNAAKKNRDVGADCAAVDKALRRSLQGSP